MSDNQQTPVRDKAVVFAGRLGIISIIGAFGWACFIHFAVSIGGGDGSGSIIPRTSYVAAYSGSLYLALIFLSCLPCIRGVTFTVIGIFAHTVLAYFAISLIAIGGILFIIPFLLVAFGWMVLFKAKRNTQPPASV